MPPYVSGDPDEWVLPRVLLDQGERRPHASWITTTDGDTLTFGEAAEDVRRVAGYLAQLGVRPGDLVGVMMPNGCDYVRVWLGIQLLGAVSVLLNTELRGAFLRHQLMNSGVELLAIDAALLPVVLELDDPALPLRRVMVTGSAPEVATGHLESVEWGAWRAAPAFDGRPPRGQDIACIMYTSGTSGPAKGVLMPHTHCTLFGIGACRALQLGADDRYYIVLPLFHSNGLLMQLGATLVAGVPAIVRPRFSASAWLGDIRTHGATVTNLLGALAAFVLAQPATPNDRSHAIRAVLNGPNVPEHEAILRERFGIPHVLSGYGMTEVNIPVWGRLGASRPGAAGWVFADHFELIVADPETDRPVAAGEIGEILVRPRTPFGFMVGYHRMPEKTVEAWRNLWFHSGDAATMDADGLVTFVDRIKDCIRRRGENISATEVEAVVSTLPGIAEVAAYAVASEIPGGEDEVMLAIVPADGAHIDPSALGALVDPLLPRFARPRFIGLVQELPRTATGKVQRNVLRQLGTRGAHDRLPARP